MAVKLNSPGWDLQRTATTRGREAAMPGLPPEFLTHAIGTEEFVAIPKPPVPGTAPRGAGTRSAGTRPSGTRSAGTTPTTLDISAELPPGEAAVLVLRYPSGALTFHGPRTAVGRTRGGPVEVRFVAPVRRAEGGADLATSRGFVSKAVKAILVKVAGGMVDSAAGFVLPKLARIFETSVWKSKGLQEGWLRVSQDALAAGTLPSGKPSSTDRSLLLIHGTFSNAASAFGPLAASNFFEAVAPLYGDRIFAFDHFSISRTPEENARMLLEGLPKKTYTFDVITHSRGGLVLRNLVERQKAFDALASRFALGRAVLVASPNEGTPLATPQRWEDTVGWVANLLELFPENPFTTGAEFVANGLVWIARHASGDLPGLHSMDGDGDLIRELQSPPGPPPDRYFALAANYSPNATVLQRLVDTGVDQFFNTANDLVVPSAGGWRVDPSGGAFIPGSRIGCFGPGGNIDRNDVTHVNFFAQPETVSFLVAALSDQPHQLRALDPAQTLPDRRLTRAGAPAAAAAGLATAVPGQSVRRARAIAQAAPTVAGDLAPALEIAVINGDLTFEDRALMVGHYQSTRLTGTERVIDSLLDRAMSSALALGVYPVEPGSHRIFINRKVQKGKFWPAPRPEAVIVAGLGPEGKLQSAHTIHSVRQAVIAWSERVRERGGRQATLSIAATLLGSGGAGMTPGQAAQLIAQGVHEANDLIRRSAANGQRLPEVRELRFVELYLNRATEAWEALKMQAHANPRRYRVAEPIMEGVGALRRPAQSGYRGAEYDFITAETRQDVNGQSFIAYALDTRRARTEVRAQATQARLLRDLVATASSELNDDPQIGRSLYNLLVPIELEAFLAGSGETQIEVDEGTAGIPWELLDDAATTQSLRAPWAIRSKLLRKFRTETFRAQVRDADTEGSFLVIGEPACPPDYPPLPGALREATDVCGLLTERGISRDSIKDLFAGGQLQSGPEARQVVDALFERSWRVVHVAGHGEPIDVKENRGGVVLSNDTFLGAAEIKAMRVVPELVFVNCCHLAAPVSGSVLREGRPQPRAYDRSAFASSVAQALIDIGVRCVVAAGWAVDDQAASAFATTFYDALLRGRRFIDAVSEARTKALDDFGGNTWAAYQCYGDPDWTLRRESTWARASSTGPEGEFDDVGSQESLRQALETLIVQSTFQGYDPAYQLGRLGHLEQRWEKMGWPVTGPVAELFARAYAAANDLNAAVRWYDSATSAAEGEVSFRMLEQASNLRVRQAVQAARVARAEAEQAAAGEAGRGGKRGAPARRAATRQRREAAGRVRTATQSARTVIKEQMKVLARLSEFQETPERESLRGAAMKRLAMLEADAGRPAAARQAIAAMARHYRRALKIARDRGDKALFYPAINLIAAELTLNAGTRNWKGLDPAVLTEARSSAREQNRTDPDFWSLVAEPELGLYEALAEGNLARDLPTIERAFQDVFKRSQGGSQWGSVHDNLQFVLAPYFTRVSPAAAKPARAALDFLKQLTTAKPAGG